MPDLFCVIFCCLEKLGNIFQIFNQNIIVNFYNLYKQIAEEKLVGDNIAFEDDGSLDEQDNVVKAIDKNTVLMVSFEMLDFDLYSSTRYAARVVSVRSRQFHLIFSY